MKNILFLQISGNMQSWGEYALPSVRGTRREPTKSGIIGIISATMGIKRNQTDEIRRLSENIKMGVRVDREGVIIGDFQTTQNVLQSDTKKFQFTKLNIKSCDIGDRYYLCDALFLVALEGEIKLLEEIRDAILDPVFPYFLGRKCCSPSLPLIADCDNCIQQFVSVEDALRNYPFLKEYYKPTRMVIDTLCYDFPKENYIKYRRRDVPVSFANRTFYERDVYEINMDCRE